VAGFAVNASWIRYELRDGAWHAHSYAGRRLIPVTAGLIGPWTADASDPNAEARVQLHWHGGDWIVNILFTNRHQGALDDPRVWLFSPKLVLEPLDADPLLVRRPYTIDPAELCWDGYAEDPEKVSVQQCAPAFAWGHGCSIVVEGIERDTARRVLTTPLAAEPWQGADACGDDLVMTTQLADLCTATDDALHALLGRIPNAYQAMIERQRGQHHDPCRAGPWRSSEAFALSRQTEVTHAIHAGLACLSRPRATWAIRMAGWVVLRETGQPHWGISQLALLLAALPCFAASQPIPAGVLDSVWLPTPLRRGASLALAVIDRALA
jgi:hypothetical protein